MQKLLISFFMAVVLLLVGCTSDEINYETISTDKAKEMYDQGVQVLDVRTPGEFAEGHIPGAELFPLQTLETELNQLEKDKEYLIICRSGNRSTEASKILINNGFTNVFNVSGGMNNWKYEVE